MDMVQRIKTRSSVRVGYSFTQKLGYLSRICEYDNEREGEKKKNTNKYLRIKRCVFMYVVEGEKCEFVVGKMNSAQFLLLAPSFLLVILTSLAN